MPSDEPTIATSQRPLRRDAQRNRDALVAAARTIFASDGLDAPLEQIARQAGVAIGTLYRNFPTRMDLVEAIFVDKLSTWLQRAEHALSMDDPWEAFAFYLEQLCELQAHDRGFNDLASMRFPHAACMEHTQGRINELSRQIVERAQKAGAVRPDITAEDLALVIWGHSRISEATAAVCPTAWRRHLGLMLDAFRAGRARPLSEPPMRPEDVYAAMVSLGGSSTCTG
ncbi:TetR/AcrR family transcriptional regulator [Sphaerisporangium corydalis]|uniref:TetR/AcrR family transcriptional regulator n=1 Tax=Sphaerisporangium corydalis TaxID=1441875 RepID=A0ABV9E8Z0_9ACTN|nr:TetR/AcrR family transcriptional regulator [Sphaerisporangium corydalis]